MVFNPFEMAVQVFLNCMKIPNFDGLNDVFPNSTGPWPRLQKGRKIPVIVKLERTPNAALQNKNQTQKTAATGIFLSFWSWGQGPVEFSFKAFGKFDAV